MTTMMDWIEITEDTKINEHQVLFWFPTSHNFYGGIQHAVYYDGWNFTSEEIQWRFDSGEIEPTYYTPMVNEPPAGLLTLEKFRENS